MQFESMRPIQFRKREIVEARHYWYQNSTSRQSLGLQNMITRSLRFWLARSHDLRALELQVQSRGLNPRIKIIWRKWIAIHVLLVLLWRVRAIMIISMSICSVITHFKYKQETCIQHKLVNQGCKLAHQRRRACWWTRAKTIGWRSPVSERGIRRFFKRHKRTIWRKAGVPSMALHPSWRTNQARQR